MEYQNEFSSVDGAPALEDRQRAALTVGQLNEYIRMLIEGNPVLSRVWVKGELSNVTNHRSGHVYFSLKDEEGVIRAVMFRSAASVLKFIPEEGMKVVIRGRVTLYGKTGQYQINVEAMQPDGVGALHVAYEQLRRRLDGEGLFDSARKQRLPKYPRRIGIITSPTGAAIQDMMQIAGRRFPLTELLLYPSLVQGDGAAAQLCEGIRFFERAHREGSACNVDCIIIGRGGGSMEDLWAFNDETLARTIAACTIPVISAVGHETDFTICDFVADCRAPTPSAAAELALPNAEDLTRQLSNVGRLFTTKLRARTDRYRYTLDKLKKTGALSRPTYTIEQKRIRLDELYSAMDKMTRIQLERKRNALVSVSGRLSALNPLGVLARGYCAVMTGEEKPVTTAAALSAGDTVVLRFSDGERQAEILPVADER